MDTNNWRPNQGTEANMDTSDWRGALQHESRQRIVNKIMDTLKRHLPVSGQEGLHELRKIAQRFEEKIFTAATSQSDYLRKISLKMLTMETKSQGTMAKPNQGGPSNKPPDPGLVIPPQVHNLWQQHPISMPNQPPTCQQLLSQNIQNNIASQPSSLGQAPIQNVGQNNPNMQNIPGQNSVGSTIGQNSNMQNMFAGSQRQIPGRQQQSQNPQQYLYQQQIQQQLLRQKLHHQQQQQQQQQNLLQPNQLQPSQQPGIQTSSVMQQPSVMPTSLPGIQHNQQSNNVQQSTQSMIQQHSQVIRQQQPQQTSIIHQQQAPMTQQSILPSQQQQPQQLMGAQANATNMQHTRILGTQNNVGDLQLPQRLLVQQNNLSNLQQQQLVNQQNNLSNIHQHLGNNNVPGLQPQQVLGPESGNSGIQTSQQSAHVLQQSQVPIQQLYQWQLMLKKLQHLKQRQQQQQLQQTAKQQLPAQLPTHQIQQLHPMNDANDINMRQGIDVKPGVFQQHLSSGQRLAYPHQQMKGSPFPVSSPQLLQATSQIPQHSSPQVDQQNLPPLTKVATSLQSANSPFVVPTPSPPLALSPMPGDSEKPISGVSSILNAANIGYQQTGGAAAPAQSLAIGTPGISSSPLLAEFTGPDGVHGNASAPTSGKSTVTEQPIERLIKAVKSMSPKALSSAVSDIGSVVSMSDRIAGSAPVNGSRAAVGDGLLAMNICLVLVSVALMLSVILWIVFC